MKSRPIKKIYYNSNFLRSYKKLPLKEKLQAEKREKIFRDNALDSRLKTHKLKGKLKDHWSFSITYSNQIMFKFLKNNEVMFYDIGPHKIYQ